MIIIHWCVIFENTVPFTCVISLSEVFYWCEFCFFIFLVVTVYATLGDEALVHAINESEVRFIITDGSLLGKLSALIDRLPKVEHIVYLGNVVKKSALLGFSRRVKVHCMSEIEEIGESQSNRKLWFHHTFDPDFSLHKSVFITLCWFHTAAISGQYSPVRSPHSVSKRLATPPPL